MTRGMRGAFKDTPPEVMLSVALKAAVQRANLDPKLVQDIAVANNLNFTTAQSTGRMAAGIPFTSTLYYFNRYGSSGMETCVAIAESIIAGRIDCGIGAGVETMSRAGWKDFKIEKNLLWEEIFTNKIARDALTPMGMTSENIAEKFGITR